MKFQIENSAISAYKRLSYEPWYAFAEFVDNSTQAYFNHQKELARLFELTGQRLTIKIVYEPDNNFIVIEDNSIGMNELDLINALKVGQPPLDPSGRSRYGLGMKTAACWFGDNWMIRTKKLNEREGHEVYIDVNKIASNDIDLMHNTFSAEESSHYTIIKITNLNRQFKGRTLGKIRDYLASMYRFDFSQYGLQLYWNGELLSWESFDEKLYITADGVRFKKHFEFQINEKKVSGWVGVLGAGHGSRRHAGFSIIQNWRVIQGWPNGYKPISIFGDQEDGSNDLINQRVIGEIFLEGFSVSHTKDRIVWESDDEDKLDEMLGRICKDAKDLATTLRFKEGESNLISKFRYEALTHFEKELKSSEISNYIRNVDPYPEKIIKASFDRATENVLEENNAALEASIGFANNEILVSIYFNEKSEFEPYVLTELTVQENKVLVIINVLHPHFQEMLSADAVLNFIRHCVYDGVSEWKCLKISGEIKPYTVKFLKDGLLRVPLEIKMNKAT